MPKITRDVHASGSILTTNTELRLVKLPPLSRIPTTYTVTLGAAAVGATSVSITSISPAPSAASPFYLGEAVEMNVGGSANYPFLGGTEVYPAESKKFTSSTGTITVEPLTSAISAGAQFRTYGMLRMLGLQGADQSQNTNLISIRDFTSGLGNEQRPTMIDFSLSLTGWVHSYDLSLTEIVRPLSRSGEEVFFEFIQRDSECQYGVALFSNYARQNQLDDVVKFTSDFIVQGTPNYRYITLATANTGGGNSPSPSPTPTTYDTTITGNNTGVSQAGVTVTSTSNTSTAKFNALNSPGGVSQTQNIYYPTASDLVMVLDFPGDYLGQPVEVFIGGANVTDTISFTGTDTTLTP